MKLTIWMLCGEVSREQEQKRKGQLGESGGSSSWDVCLGLPPGGGGGGKGWRLGCAGRARQTGSADGPGGKCGRERSGTCAPVHGTPTVGGPQATPIAFHFVHPLSLQSQSPFPHALLTGIRMHPNAF